MSSRKKKYSGSGIHCVPPSFTFLLWCVVDANKMQLHIRGQNQHVLECQGEELISQIKARIAALENIGSEDFCLFASGAPVSDDSPVSEFAATSLELTVPLLGGKVHGSLARAGKVKGQTPKPPSAAVVDPIPTHKLIVL
ncbi:Ribosomal protein S30 [Carabus blaptoides fortunei]